MLWSILDKWGYPFNSGFNVIEKVAVGGKTEKLSKRGN